MENIVKIVQPAILAEQFDAIGKEVDEKITRAQGLVVSDQNYKDAKKIRASLNREAAAYASDFREIKKQALAPWEAIESRYNTNIRDKYREADKIMKEKISTIEGGLKAQKEQEVMDYFEELRKANGLHFVTWEDMGVKILLSASMKSMKDAVTDRMAMIKSGYDAIIAMDDDISADVLAEYKRNGYLMADAITTVTDRRRRAEEEEQERLAAIERRKAEEEHRAQVLEEVKEAVPEIVKAPEPPVKREPQKVEATFTVTTSLAQMRSLVQFMRANNIEFEQVK